MRVIVGKDGDKVFLSSPDSVNSSSPSSHNGRQHQEQENLIAISSESMDVDESKSCEGGEQTRRPRADSQLTHDDDDGDGDDDEDGDDGEPFSERPNSTSIDAKMGMCSDGTHEFIKENSGNIGVRRKLNAQNSSDMDTDFSRIGSSSSSSRRRIPNLGSSTRQTSGRSQQGSPSKSSVASAAQRQSNSGGSPRVGMSREVTVKLVDRMLQNSNGNPIAAVVVPNVSQAVHSSAAAEIDVPSVAGSSASGGANSARLKANAKHKGLEVLRMAGDGNCLFRAISLQIYGDPNWHNEVRASCMDYIARERDHFGDFVAGENEDFDSYVARKRQDGCYGNNTEIQAVAEIYNRALEVYQVVGVVTNNGPRNNAASPRNCPNRNTTHSSASTAATSTSTQSFIFQLNEMNIFHGTYQQTADPPIRLLYTNKEHYDAVVDPYEATAGVGLGMPGLKAGSMEKGRIEEAKKLSLKDFDQFGRIAGPKNGKSLQSDQDATQAAMEKAVIAASLIDYWNYQRSSGTQPRDEAAAASSSSSSSSHWSGRARAMSTEKEHNLEGSRKRTRTLSSTGGGSSSSDLRGCMNVGSSSSHAINPEVVSARNQSDSRDLGHMPASAEPVGNRSGSDRSSTSSTSPQKRKLNTESAIDNREEEEEREENNTTLEDTTHVSKKRRSSFESQQGISIHPNDNASASAASSSSTATPKENNGSIALGDDGLGLGSLNDHQQLVDAGVFPPCVEELVFNGFEVSKVLDAYSIFGDRFDDMLAYLMQQQRRPQE